MTAVKISKKNSVQLEFVSSDSFHLNEVIQKCIEVIKSTGGYYSNVVRLPNRKQFLLVLNRSPHVYSCSKDQFKQTKLKACMYVKPSANTLKALTELVMIRGGVQVRMVLNNYEEGRHE